MRHIRLYPIAALIAVYLLLALASLLISPSLEGTDEFEHVARVVKGANDDFLPDPRDVSVPGQYHQPPLYYALMSVVLRWTGSEDFNSIYPAQTNPYYNGLTDPAYGTDNRTRFLHQDTQEFPQFGSATLRGVYLMRLMSVGLGLITLVASAGILRRLFPHRALIFYSALAVTALNPQFVYVTSHVTNDAASIAICAVGLWWLLRLLERRSRIRDGIVLGVILGAGLLIKTTVVPLGLAVAVAFVLSRPHRAPLIVSALTALGIAAWWFIRNGILYGDPTLNSINATVWFVQPLEPFTLPYLAERLWMLHQRIWGVFGLGTVWSPAWIYVLSAILLVIGVIGSWVALRRLRGRGRWRPVLVTGAMIVGMLTFTLYLTLTIWQGNQGRYLLNVEFGIGAVVAAGAFLFPRRTGNAYAGFVIAVMIASAIAALVHGLYPAYRVTLTRDDSTPALIRYGDTADLLAIQPTEIVGQHGDLVSVTLTWRVRQPGGDWRTYIHAIDGSFKHDSYPGTGRHQAANWQAGQVWSETHHFRIPDTMVVGSVYPLVVGLYDPATAAALPAFDGVGNSVTPIAAQIIVQSASIIDT